MGREESDYRRCGALQYLCAWDVQLGLPWGRCEPKTGIAPFGRLVEQVMTQEPYRSARRVCWIVDNGSCHRGQKAADRLTKQYPNLVLVHTPVHAPWLNQQELYFEIMQRKVLIPQPPTISPSWSIASSPSKHAHAHELDPSLGASPVLTSSAAFTSLPHDPS